MNETRPLVAYRQTGAIAEVVLDRPHRLNAITPELLEDLLAALDRAERDPQVGAIVLRGEGRAFCAGDDLKDFDRQASDEAGTRAYIERIQDVTRALMGGETIVVGAIHGWAVGGGLEWVVNCDLAVMARGCRCFFPEAALGVFVTGGVSSLLPQLLGLQKAKELILLGERFDAREALRLGLVTRLAGDQDYLDQARQMAVRVAELPPVSRRNVKKVLNRAYALGLDAAMALEVEATVEGFLDPETAARVAKAAG